MPYPDPGVPPPAFSRVTGARMAVHRLWTDEPLSRGLSRLEIRGNEAQHALRVKRLREGDPVLILDGRGWVAHGRLASSGKAGREWRLEVEIASVQAADPVSPRVEVWSVVPKGPRLAEVIEGSGQ